MSPVEIAEDVSAAAERLAGTVIAMRQAIRLRPAPPPPPPPITVTAPAAPTPEDRLRSWVTRHAVFFANGTDFRDVAAAERDLDTLAALIEGTDLTVRIVGYTDERGGLERNNTLAQERARTVLDGLLDRGVAPSRLVTVGRANGRDLAPDSGPDSANRRVEFEIGFAGEGDGARR